MELENALEKASTAQSVMPEARGLKMRNMRGISLLDQSQSHGHG
jgi:hypothetical protein